MPVSRREMRAAARRVVASPEWEHATRLARFLEFVVEQTASGKADLLTDREIGIAVFGRGPDYDPKADNVVRTEARRLRTRLEEYYQGSGLNDAVRIELPRGLYTPEFAYTGKAVPPRFILPAFPALSLRVLVVAALVVAVVGGAFLARRIRLPHLGSNVVGPARKLTRGIGNARTPAVSPDGSRIAYTVDTDATHSNIFVLEIDGSSRTVTFGNVMDFDPVWAPNGVDIAFLRRLDPGRFALMVQDTAKYTDTGRQLAQLSVRGGLDWTPDGSAIVTADHNDSNPQGSGLIRVDLAGGRRTALTSAAADTSPVFSPDGNWLAFIRDQQQLLVMPAAGGTPRLVAADGRRFQGLCWTPDSQSLIGSAERGNNARALWRFPLAGGEATRISDSGYAASHPSMPRQGRGLAFALRVADSNLWAVRPGDHSESRRLSESDQIDSNPELSPDGRQLVWRSTRSGNSEIWIAAADGSRARQLTQMQGPHTGNPRWSPDGGSIVFESRCAGNADIFMIAVSGGPARPVIAGPANEVVPSFSRDGRSILYSSDRNGTWELLRRDVASGRDLEVAARGAIAGVESYDGRNVFFTRQGREIGGIWMKPVAGGAEELVVGELPGKFWGQWAISRQAIFYAVFPDAGTQVVRRVDLASRRISDVATLQRVPLANDSGMTVASDESWLIWTQMDQSGSDIYWMDRFR